MIREDNLLQENEEGADFAGQRPLHFECTKLVICGDQKIMISSNKMGGWNIKLYSHPPQKS